MPEWTGEERRKHIAMDDEISGLVREMHQRQQEVVIPKLGKIDELVEIVREHDSKIQELWDARKWIIRLVFGSLIMALLALVIKK